jgi:hypothetical protein
MSDYRVILKGLVFGDWQSNDATEPRLVLERHIELSFVPWVGLFIEWEGKTPANVRLVSWNQTNKCFECSVWFGYDEDDSLVVSECEMKAEGWIDE